MSKKILSLALVAVMLFTFCCINVSAEEIENPELTLTKEVTITVFDSYTLTDSSLSPFGVEVNLDDKEVVAFDGSTTEHNVEILKISTKRSGQSTVVYDPENPDEFLDTFRFGEGEEKESIGITVAFKVDYKYDEVFGDLGYEIVINGFSTPPNLGIDLGNAVAVPTPITYSGEFTEFPKIGSINILNASEKMVYLDSEYVEIEGTCLEIQTVTHEYDTEGKLVKTTPHLNGTVTYAPQNAHMFTTVPSKSERIPVNTKEIVTFFSGVRLSSLAVSVSHDWSSSPVSITSDKYSDNKPGYHAIVCNGCGENHTPQPHVPTYKVDDSGNVVLDENGNPVEDWKSNEDATFTGNGTASSTCQDCGATLTKDVLGSAQFNTAFSNYHFLLVIFEYINLILRIIGASVG